MREVFDFVGHLNSAEQTSRAILEPIGISIPGFGSLILQLQRGPQDSNL